jgi:PAS domain S-box-containing protein
MTQTPTYKELKQRINKIGNEAIARQQAEEALERSEQKYRSIFESIQDVYYEVTTDGIILELSPSIQEVSQYRREELIGKSLYEIYVDPRKRDEFVKELQNKRKVSDYEILLKDKDGSEVCCSIAARLMTDNQGRPAKIIGSLRNITRRKQAEQALQKAHDELERRVEERTAELVQANKKLRAEIIQRKQVENELLEKTQRLNIAYEQAITYAQQFNEQMAERKRAEKALFNSHEKLRSLASKLSLAEEQQRRQVAIEVHDRISQNLAFVKLKLGALRESTSFSSLAGNIDEVLKLVDETIQNTRALISELGSPILYELGFVPAVEWLTQQVQRQQGIVVEFEDDRQPKPLSEDVRVLLFQAARELLINIAKHAKARTAKVSITRNRTQVRVDVEDDGVGFDIAEISPSVDTTGRFGLFSIRVRLEPLGGHMEIDSKTGHGTRVTLVAPLKHNRGNKKEKVS